MIYRKLIVSDKSFEVLLYDDKNVVHIPWDLAAPHPGVIQRKIKSEEISKSNTVELQWLEHLWDHKN